MSDVAETSRAGRWLHAVSDRVFDAGFHPARAYLVVLLVSTTVVSRWFRAGTFIATGDMGPFIRRGWEPEVLWSWNHQISGAGSAAHTIGRAFEFLLIWISAQFGADETVAQWMFYTIIYGLVGFGIAYAAGAIVRSEWGIILAGSFGVINGFFLTRIPNPLNIISVGTVALMTGIALRVAKGQVVPAPLAGFAFLPTSFLAFNPPMFVVAAAWAAGGTCMLALFIVGWRGLGRLLRWFVLAAPWVILLNLWWIVPFMQAYVGGGGAQSNAAFTDPTNWTWSQINNQIPNILTMVANWAWFRPQYLPFAADLDRPEWVWMRYVLPAVVFLAPLAARPVRRRAAFVFLGLVGVFVFLAKGLMPPLTAVNMFFYMNVPMFWLFREPMSKLGQLLVTFFGILMAILVEGVMHRWQRRSAHVPRPARFRFAPRWPSFLPNPTTVAMALTVMAGLMILAYPYPVFTGSVIPDTRPMQPAAHVRVPQFWRDIADQIDTDPRPGKVLILPLDDYYQMPTSWGFFGVDSIANLLIRHPVVTPKPDGYFGDVPGYKADVAQIQVALLSGDLASVPRLLDASGIGKIVLRHDLMRDMPGRSFADDTILAKALGRTPGVRKVSDGKLELWEVGDGSSQQVRAYDNEVTTGPRPDAGAAVLGSIGTANITVPQLSSAKAPLSPVVDDSVQATEDSVQWPVPAVDRGPPTTQIELLDGMYEVAQRARAAAVLTPEVDKAQRELVFSDPTRVRIDGRVVSRRPDLRIPIPRTDVLGLKVGSRSVSLDGWGREAMPRKPGAPVVPAAVSVGSATPLKVYVPSEQPADPSPMSAVYDCNNYEPRPAAELELRREVRQTRQGPVIRLSALDHAACTKIDILDAAPGRTYRVRLEYKMVKGKRPQICLWQVGTDGCELAPRPMISAGWHPYERYVTVEEVASKLILVLHADVGERLLGRTVTEYRNISIEAVDTALDTEIWAPEVPQQAIRLKAGTHTLSVTGGQAGSSLAEFEPLQDCFRYDDQTTQQAGLMAEQTGDLRDPTYVLGARSHMACLGATVPDMGQSSLYELSLEARKVAVRDPKFCLYLRGPDSCQKLPVGGPWKEWTLYQTLVGPDPKAVETRLYLYGMRDIAEEQQSRVEYRGLRLTPVASPVSVVLVRHPKGGLPKLMSERRAEVDYRQVSPVQWSIKSPPGAALVSLIETSAPGWSLTGHGKPVSGNGWMAAWRVNRQPVEGTIRYVPSALGRKALMLLPVALVGAFLAMGAGKWWRGWRARRRERRAA